MSSAYRRLWMALAATLLLGVAVVVALPQLVGVPGQAPAGDAPRVSPAQPAAPGAGDAAARGAAEQNLRTFLRLRARLELAGAQRWGEPDWSRAGRHAMDADQAFARQRFAAAAEGYALAGQLLETLEAGRDERLARALENGRQALDANDLATARAGFELALLIEPEHAGARQGLARARVREQVNAVMVQGRQAEQAGALETARDAYREAVALDSEYAPAAASLQQVEQRLADNAFQLAMSEALSALDAGRLAAAQQALQQAAALRPEDSSLRDARQRLAQSRQRASLEHLRSEAAARVGSEDWSAALRLYREALSLEPAAAFAHQGIAQAEQRERLHRQLDDYLADPAALHAPEPLADAERLLASLGTPPAAEPQLAAKMTRLKARAEAAGTPVTVTLRSDGDTEVVIYHVGRLGRFQVQQLQLRPGTYTAVGSRPGYRDVRAVFRVEPGTPPPPVAVTCEERV